MLAYFRFRVCTRHFGAVYTLGADGGSQNVVVSNCTFQDCSGGAIKLGSSGERGDPAPDPATAAADQDRGTAAEILIVTATATSPLLTLHSLVNARVLRGVRS